MESNNHSHLIWAIVAVLGIGMLAWIYSSNRPDIENIGKDGTKIEDNDHKWGLIIEIGKGSCAHMPRIIEC